MSLIFIGVNRISLGIPIDFSILKTWYSITYLYRRISTFTFQNLKSQIN